MKINYVLSTLFITMSCTTTAVCANQSQPVNEKGFYPAKSVEIPFEQAKYVICSEIPSYTSIPQAEEQNDFNILVSFANKMLNHEVGVDLEIQKVINNCFWDML